EVLEKTAANRPSMLQDLESGRRTENEAISGYILKAAEKKGVELPATKVVYSLMKLAEHAAIKDYVV
ncbi:MAG TPA: 2-dehydropantoate 2-reductase, partial [Thermovirga lienii]|nr:2-dehydropantoate 2-reductase [Thermovirga lienii]